MRVGDRELDVDAGKQRKDVRLQYRDKDFHQGERQRERYGADTEQLEQPLGLEQVLSRLWGVLNRDNTAPLSAVSTGNGFQLPK